MNSKKKAQLSIEFMIIFIFIFIIFFLLVSFLMSLAGDINQEKNQLSINSFTDEIESEYQIMQKVQKGYYREVEIPNYILQRYNITVGENYILVIDLESNHERNAYFKTFSGVGEIGRLERDKDSNGIDETYLFFRRD